MSGMCVWESLCLIIWLSLSHPEPRALQSSGLNCPSFHCQARRVLVCFFLSSTCMTVIWNSTIIRTARKRGPGSCLLELAWQYFYPPSPVSCPLELSFLSFSLMTHFFTLFIGFSIIFSLYVFLKVCFITSILYCLIFLRSTSTYTRAHAHTRSHTSSVFRCCLTGLSLCLTHIFIFHNITTCQERQPFSCLLLLLTHITLKWSKRKGCRQTTECLTMLAFQNYISRFPKHQSPGQSFGALCRTQRATGWENQIWFTESDWIWFNSRWPPHT